MKNIIFILSLSMCLSTNATELYNQKTLIDMVLFDNFNNYTEAVNSETVLCGNNEDCNNGIFHLGQGVYASGTGLQTLAKTSTALAQPFITSLNVSALPFTWILNWFGG